MGVPRIGAGSVIVAGNDLEWSRTSIDVKVDSLSPVSRTTSPIEMQVRRRIEKQWQRSVHGDRNDGASGDPDSGLIWIKNEWDGRLLT